MKLNLRKLKKQIWKRNIKEGNMDEEGNTIKIEDEFMPWWVKARGVTCGLVLCQGCLRPFYTESFDKGDTHGLHSQHEKCQEIIHQEIIKEQIMNFRK